MGAVLGRVPACAALAVLLSTASAAAEPVKLLTPKNYKARVVAPKKGRVVVVNFWATWCEPCREEMPALVTASRGFKVQDLAVVLVSIDSQKTGATQVPKFLASMKVPFVCWLAKSQDPSDFINAVDRTWDGTVPYTLVYDRKGNLSQKLLGKQTAADFTASIRKAAGS